MSDKLAVLKKMVEEASKQEITMVYLDEESALQCVALPIEGDEPTTDEWVVGTPDDSTLLAALRVAEENREHYFSSRW